MEFEQLRHFIKVAELSSFTRAAESLVMSQPAISRSIARLEEELGQPLFERQTRRVALSDAGQLLLVRARQIIALADDVKSEISDDGQSGRLRVGAIPTIAPYLLPKVLRKFHDAFPKAIVSVQEDTTESLIKRLAAGEVDLAICALPLEAKYLKVEMLCEEELMLVMATDHPLCEKKQIRLSDVESLPFVLLNEAHCLTDNIVSFCRQKSFHPISVERTNQLATVQELVALDHGVSMIPAMAQALDLSDRRIYRSLAGTKPTRRIVVAWNPYRFESKLQHNFVACLKKDARS